MGWGTAQNGTPVYNEVFHVPIKLQEMILSRTLCETEEVGDVMGSRGKSYERSLGDWLRASSSAILQKVMQH